jgi:SepF-like predicted cell division protein (DUF552 family)
MADQPTDMIVPLLQALRGDIQSLRADVKQLEARIDSDFIEVRKDIKDLRADVKGIKVNAIAEIYKANLTVASFAELSQRLRRVEEAVFPQAS